MRRVVIVLAGLALAGTGVLVRHAGPSGGGCATTLQYDGVSYRAHQVSDEIVGEDVGAVGAERGCGDRGAWSTEIAVARVPGVDARTALVTPVAADVVFVAEGVSIGDLPPAVAEVIAQR